MRLGPEDDVLSIGMNRAIALLEDAGRKTRPAPAVLKELGPHPKDKKPIVLYRGRFGPYLKHGQQNVSLPKGRDPDSLTLEEGVKLLQEKAAKGKGKATGASAGRPSKATGQVRPGGRQGRRAREEVLGAPAPARIFPRPSLAGPEPGRPPKGMRKSSSKTRHAARTRRRRLPQAADVLGYLEQAGGAAQRARAGAGVRRQRP